MVNWIESMNPVLHAWWKVYQAWRKASRKEQQVYVKFKEASVEVRFTTPSSIFI
jgi:hypothetical protein